jgi:hypothetical protein
MKSSNAIKNSPHTRRHDWIRRFNKAIFNRIMMAFAGKWSYAAVIHHIGRRSGRAYQTPILCRPLGDYFYAPLPYGDGTDWCLNVLAAGECTLTWQNEAYHLTSPVIIGADEALPAFSERIQASLVRNRVVQYLRLARPPVQAG